MGIKLKEVAVGESITLHMYNTGGKFSMNATVKSHVKENVAIISIDYQTKKKLVFDKVMIRVEYKREGDIPILWNGAKVVAYKSDYVIQVLSDGVRNNRRNSFRVGVSKLADTNVVDGPRQVMVRDVSLSGFSVTDKKGELNLKMGSELRIKLDDMGHLLDLRGVVVRIEELEGGTIYGFEICNLCKELSSYVTLKQRKIRMANDKSNE